MSKNVAPVTWAQRKESLYLTICLSDCKDANVKLTDKGLLFSGKAAEKDYELNLEFFKEIEAEGSIYNVLPGSIQMKLTKKDKESEFWPRLLENKVLEKTNVKIDWNRFKGTGVLYFYYCSID